MSSRQPWLVPFASLAIAGAAWGGMPQAALEPPVPVGPPRPGAETDPDLQWYRAIIQNPSNTAAVRQGAAERLAARGSADALRILEESLRSGDAGQVEAVASAFDDEGRTRPSLLDPLLVALQRSPRSLHPKLARLILREGDSALGPLLSVARDNGRPPAERLGAIYALSLWRSRDPVPELVTLLDERRREPADVLRETCEALERATGQRLGPSADAWRAWWEARRADPTRHVTIASLQEQAGQLQKRLDQESERGTRLASRLQQTYLDLFAALPAAERSERLVTLVEDELPDVRGLALSLVDRMLRNGERPSEALVQRVQGRLKDPNPALRVRAMRLLDDLSFPQLAERVAETLPAESDPTAADAALKLLASRPTPTAFGPAAARLQEPALAESAALVINRLSDAAMVPAGWESRVVDPARRAVRERPTPELARLLALSGNDADRDAVAKLLESRDDALRVGAAEGLRRSGLRRPLLERAASDPLVYPVALAALADQPASPALVAALLALPPSPGQEKGWNESAARVLNALGARDILAVDESLAAPAWVDWRIRTDAMQVALADPSLSAEPALQTELLLRLADALIANGDARTAVTVLGGAKVGPGSPLRSRLFKAAVMGGEFDLAWQVETAPDAWLDLLKEMTTRDPAAARLLADDIGIRFNGRLSPAQKARLDAFPSAPKTPETP